MLYCHCLWTWHVWLYFHANSFLYHWHTLCGGWDSNYSLNGWMYEWEGGWMDSCLAGWIYVGEKLALSRQMGTQGNHALLISSFPCYCFCLFIQQTFLLRAYYVPNSEYLNCTMGYLKRNMSGFWLRAKILETDFPYLNSVPATYSSLTVNKLLTLWLSFFICEMRKI